MKKISITLVFILLIQTFNLTVPATYAVGGKPIVDNIYSNLTGAISLSIDEVNDKILLKSGVTVDEVLTNITGSNIVNKEITDAQGSEVTDASESIIEGMKLVLRSDTEVTSYTLSLGSAPSLTSSDSNVRIDDKWLKIENISSGTTTGEFLTSISNSSTEESSNFNTYIIDERSPSTNVLDTTELNEYYKLIIENGDWVFEYNLQFKIQITLSSTPTVVKELNNNTFYIYENSTVSEFLNDIDFNNSNIDSVTFINACGEDLTGDSIITDGLWFSVVRSNMNYGYNYEIVADPNQNSDSTSTGSTSCSDSSASSSNDSSQINDGEQTNTNNNQTPTNTNSIGIKAVNIEFVDSNGQPINGAKQFRDEFGEHFYLPQSSEFYLNVSAIGFDDKPIGPPYSSIDLSEFAGDNIQPTPTYDSTTNKLTTYTVRGGYKDNYQGKIIIDDYEVNTYVYVYKGSLGLLDVKTPDNQPYQGPVEYSINYKFQDGSGAGSSSDGRVYGTGVLPIPIQDDFIGVDYAYTIVTPTQLGDLNGTFTHTPFVDLTQKLASGTTNGVFELGEAVFQSPEVTVNVVDQNNQPWRDTVNYITVSYNGEIYNFSGVRYHVVNESGKFYLASLGGDFSSNVNVDVIGYNSPNMPIQDTIDLQGNSEITLNSPLEDITGSLLQPDGSSIPTGSNRDANVIIQGITDTSFDKHSAYRDTGDYGLTGLTVGHEYWIQGHLDLGDFYDVNLTDSYRLRFTYTKEEGTYFATDEYGRTYPYSVNSDGVMVLYIKMTTPLLEGTVYMGQNPVNDNTGISIINPDTKETIAWGTAYGGEGKYSIGGMQELQGDYIIRVEDPTNSIDYTGDVFTLNFPVSQDYDIYLPETNVYGNIVLAEDDQTQYANNIRRVYVNVFDEHGSYVTNGRVRSDGVFSVGQISNGRYYAQAFVSAYSTVAEDYMTSDKHPFVVSEGSNKISFDVPLKKVIGSGIVFDPNDNPVSNIWVRIFDENREEVAYVNTNDQGKFYLPKLEAGTYKVKAYGQNGFTDSLFETITITEQTSNLSISLSLTNPSISGNVTAEGTVPNVDILLFDENKEYITFTTTGEDGRYALGGLAPGNYFIQAIPKDSVIGFTQTSFIPVEITAESISFDISLESIAIQGKVEGPNGETITKGWVQVFKNDQYVTSVKLESDGTFKIGDIDTDTTYTLVADGSKTRYLPSEEQMVQSGDHNVILTLNDRASIKGKVTFGSLVKEKQAIYIYKSNEEPVKVIYTNVFGEFKNAGLENGDYILVIKNGESPYIQEFTYDGTEIDLGTINIE